MARQFDIVIRRARLRQHPAELCDLAIAGGRIVEVAATLEGSAKLEIAAGGNLVTEAFANPHLHLCKTHTLPLLGEAALRNYHNKGMGQAMTAIEMAARIKKSYAESWIVHNARRAVALAVVHGNTHIRAFADVDTKARLEAVKALLRVREEFRNIVDIQVVAFPQDGIVREAGASELLRRSLEAGADVVGGIPWIEYTEAEAAQHIGLVFDLAQEFDRDVSMLVDDAGDPGLRTLEMLAVETIRRGRQGRVLAHHARAMSLYAEPYFRKLIGLLRLADLPVVSDPHTGPLHARVRELLEAGVNVSLGQDDISDAYYPYGRNNMLEVAFLASHLLWMTAPSDMEMLLDMVTVRAFQAMRLRDVRLAPGSPAHVVVLEAPNVLEALRAHAAPTHVISHGRLVDLERMKVLAEAPPASPDGV
jgi:cytosine deaminase